MIKKRWAFKSLEVNQVLTKRRCANVQGRDTISSIQPFVKSLGSCLIVGSAYHTSTNSKVERAHGVVRVSDTLRAFANCCKDDWDDRPPLTVFAINNAASTMGNDLTPFSVDRGAHRLPLSPPRDDSDLAYGESHTTRSGCGRCK